MRQTESMSHVSAVGVFGRRGRSVAPLLCSQAGRVSPFGWSGLMTEKSAHVPTNTERYCWAVAATSDFSEIDVATWA